MSLFEGIAQSTKAITVALQISSRPIAHVTSLVFPKRLPCTRHGIVCSGSLNFYRGSADVEAPCVVEPGKDSKSEKLSSRGGKMSTIFLENKTWDDSID